MKTRMLVIIAALGLSGATLVGTVGCAGGPMSKSTGEYIDDAAITAKVKAELLRDPVVSGMAVNVDTYKGTVQLNGFVDSAQQAQRAVEIAQRVPGVTGVQNKLSVKTQVPQNQAVH